MTEAATLRDILLEARRAAQPGRPRDRALAPEAAGGHIGALLAEISQTILPRRLTFALGKGRQLVIEAGNRRLLKADAAGIAADAAGIAADAAGIAADAALGRDEGTRLEELSALRGLLTGFGGTGGDGDLVVRSDPATLVMADGAGFTVAEIEAALREPEPGPAPEAAAAPPEEELAPKPAAEEPAPKPAATAQPPKAAPAAQTRAAGPSRARAMIEACESHAGTGAAADPEGNVTALRGEDGAVPIAGIVALVARQMRMNEPFLEVTIPGEIFVLMGARTDDLPSLCCFADGSEVIVATVAGSDVDSVLSAWRPDGGAG